MKMDRTLQAIFEFSKQINFNEDQKAQIRKHCFSKKRYISNAAIDLLYKIVEPADYLFLVNLFVEKKRFADQIEVVECMSKINTFQSRLFLRSIAQIKRNSLVKYYAIRNLIELDPDSISFLNLPYSRIKSSFKKSLWIYNRYLHEYGSKDELIAIVKQELKCASKSAQYDWRWLEDEMSGKAN